MTNILAIDPGLHGALAVLDSRRGRLDIYDMPTTMGKIRQVLNELEIWNLLSMLADTGLDAAVIEQVNGLPGQSASAAFNFGFGVGLLKMALVAKGVPVEMVPPATWKAEMRVNRDKSSAISRANDLIPSHAHLWGDGAKGDKRTREGRAEAALLALYQERRIRPKQGMWVRGQRQEG